METTTVRSRSGSGYTSFVEVATTRERINSILSKIGKGILMGLFNMAASPYRCTQALKSGLRWKVLEPIQRYSGIIYCALCYR